MIWPLKRVLETKLVTELYSEKNTSNESRFNKNATYPKCGQSGILGSAVCKSKVYFYCEKMDNQTSIKHQASSIKHQAPSTKHQAPSTKKS